MPWCCVSDCTNNPKTGFRLFRLPSGKTNAERRQLWLSCMGRADVTDHSKICEAHFSPDQFEFVREDGRKLLKPFAYPDLLIEMPSICLTETIRIIAEDDETSSANNLDGSDISITSLEDNDDDDISKDGFIQRVEQLNHVINKLKRKLDESSRKYHQLKKKLKQNAPTQLENIFTKDQLQYLERNTHGGSTWSSETIQKALKLYLACGAKGYEEICRQKLPYPSLRTIQHHVRNIAVHQIDGLESEEKDQG